MFATILAMHIRTMSFPLGVLENLSPTTSITAQPGGHDLVKQQLPGAARAFRSGAHAAVPADTSQNPDHFYL
jgi:hypothetical protein